MENALKLLTPTLSFTAEARSDCGLHREANEDSYLLMPEEGVFAVADGLGGLPHGALASRSAVDLLRERLLCRGDGPELDLEALVREVNAGIVSLGERISSRRGIGTTLTLVRLDEGFLRFAHVGDSRALLFRDGIGSSLTTDHTMEQEFIERFGDHHGLEIPEHFAHTLTRCIGQRERLDVDCGEVRLQPGDRVLLCTDGITKVVPPGVLQSMIARYDNPGSFLDAVIDRANELGGPDNETGVALFLGPRF